MSWRRNTISITSQLETNQEAKIISSARSAERASHIKETLINIYESTPERDHSHAFSVERASRKKQTLTDTCEFTLEKDPSHALSADAVSRQQTSSKTICAVTLEWARSAVISAIRSLFWPNYWKDTWKCTQTRSLTYVLFAGRVFHNWSISTNTRRCISVEDLTSALSAEILLIRPTPWDDTKGFILERSLTRARIVERVSFSLDTWERMRDCTRERSHTSALHVRGASHTRVNYWLICESVAQSCHWAKFMLRSFTLKLLWMLFIPFVNRKQLQAIASPSLKG